MRNKAKNKGQGFRRQILDLDSNQTQSSQVGQEEALLIQANQQKADSVDGVQRVVNAATALPVAVAASSNGIRIQDSSQSASSTQQTDSQTSPSNQTQQIVTDDDSSADDDDSHSTDGGSSSTQQQSQAQIDQVLETALRPFLQQIESLQTRVDEVNGRLDSTQAERDQALQQLDQAQEQLDQAQEQDKFLEALGRLAGRNLNTVDDAQQQQSASDRSPTIRDKQVNFNTQTSVNDSPQGLCDDLISLMNDAGRAKINRRVRDTGSGYVATQRDGKVLSNFIHRCFAEARSQGKSWEESDLIKDVEQWFQSAGMLSGVAQTEAVAGPTTGAAGKVPNGYLDVLSAIMRETHNPSNIFWQFTRTVYDPSSAPSKNILVPRIHYLDEPTNIDDYLLADFDTYRSVGLSVGTDSDSQSQVITDVPIGIAQYGLGRGNQIYNRPVFIPEFHEATSLIDLIAAVDMQLMQNYYRFEELLIRLRYEASTIIRYNRAGESEDTATNITAASDDGRMTSAFADAIYSEMYEATVPSLSDSCYMLALNARALLQFKQSQGDDWEAPTESELQRLTSMLTAATGVNIGRANGYMGKYNGFHVFASNSFGKGAAAASPSVNSVTLGGSLGDVDMVDSFAFGPGAVGRGVALPMEIRPSGVVPFGMGESYIWVSREGIGDLDVDSAIDADQQDRVWKLRTVRNALSA